MIKIEVKNEWFTSMGMIIPCKRWLEKNNINYEIVHWHKNDPRRLSRFQGTPQKGWQDCDWDVDLYFMSDDAIDNAIKFKLRWA